MPSSAGGPANPEPAYAPDISEPNFLEGFAAVARLIGLELMPWQARLAATMTATVGERWKHTEVCAVVSRQNGKSRPIAARILAGLLRAEKIGHVAQHRELPRKTYLEVSAVCETLPQFSRAGRAPLA